MILIDVFNREWHKNYIRSAPVIVGCVVCVVLDQNAKELGHNVIFIIKQLRGFAALR